MPITVTHLNCGRLHKPPGPVVACHCLLLRDIATGEAALIDSGIGLEDCRDLERRIGRQAIDMAGFVFDESLTARRQTESLGLASSVRHIILTHLDPDHAGGLADFPSATVHLSQEEHAAAVLAPPAELHPRYRPAQWSHAPRFQTYAPSLNEEWLGRPSRRVTLPGWPDDAVRLIWLPGHTTGHCGVAVRTGPGTWLLHAGDAYYLRAQLADPAHPVWPLTDASATDQPTMRRSIEHLRPLLSRADVHMHGYHDTSELPATS